MSRRALVLRPAPGNARTCAALSAAGVDAVAVPLFSVVPCAWDVPDPGDFDALLLTSANAVRHAGDGLARLATLPVLAVGAATARAASAAGLRVEHVGAADAASVVAHAGPARRLLHLAGRDRIAMPVAHAITVYASAPLPVAAEAMRAAVDGVVLLHSIRAAARFATLARELPRARIRVATLSAAIAAAVGTGWGAVAVAARPTDAALVAAATRLAIDP